MAIYIVGDVQGCFSELIALLTQVNFNKKQDQLWLAGDLVARGTESLATLRFVKSLKKSAKVVLGNHDLHLLAVHAGIRKEKKQDNLSELLNADDVDELLDWLAQQPLLQKLPNENAYMTHAGISPQWSLKKALKQAAKAHKKLASKQRGEWLKVMYGETPNDWRLAKTDIEKFRYTINSFTRMRFCFTDGTLEFEHKHTPLMPNKKLSNKEFVNFTDENIPLTPWYELSKTIKKHTWIFGHWAALMGETSQKNIHALDTGCVWGNHLTMMRWHDKKIFTEQAHIK